LGSDAESDVVSGPAPDEDAELVLGVVLVPDVDAELASADEVPGSVCVLEVLVDAEVVEHVGQSSHQRESKRASAPIIFEEIS
jgi:hypothetical protein